MSKTISYLRVSTADQNLDKFRADVLQFASERGFGRVEFITEKISGKVPWRARKIGAAVDGLGPDDQLIVPELSRLGRSTIEILEIMQEVRARGASLYAVKGSWQFDDSIQSKVFAMFFAMMAEIERDLISLRTREALAAKQAAGVKLGRPPGPGKSKLDDHAENIKAWRETQTPKSWIAKQLGTSTQNLSNWMKKNGVK
jgi:DNA invertase Pin-like site-specific DNA recombinase